MSDDIAASRRKLIAELQHVCNMEAVIVNDTSVLHMHSLLKQSLHHLQLPEKAGLDLIISSMQLALRTLEDKRQA